MLPDEAFLDMLASLKSCEFTEEQGESIVEMVRGRIRVPLTTRVMSHNGESFVAALMPEYELLATTNAQIWADEFMKRFADRRSDIDSALMLGWFANAMHAQEVASRHAAESKVRLNNAQIAVCLNTAATAAARSGSTGAFHEFFALARRFVLDEIT